MSAHTRPNFGDLNFALDLISLFFYYTHHEPDKLEILCISHFADVVEENWELSQINGKGDLRKNPLNFNFKKSYDLVCKLTELA